MNEAAPGNFQENGLALTRATVKQSLSYLWLELELILNDSRGVAWPSSRIWETLSTLGTRTQTPRTPGGKAPCGIIATKLLGSAEATCLVEKARNLSHITQTLVGNRTRTRNCRPLPDSCPEIFHFASTQLLRAQTPEFRGSPGLEPWAAGPRPYCPQKRGRLATC